MIKFLIYFLLLFAVVTFASADSKHKHHKHHHEHNPTVINITNVTEVTEITNITEGASESFVTNQSDLVTNNLIGIGEEYLAGTMAVSNLDFSSSTRQWQLGAATGFYGNAKAIAIGAGKLVPKWDMMFRASVTPIGDDIAYGIGMTWKVP
jgi:hypothetical protein